MDRNGYFQIVNYDDRLSMHFYAPQGAGEKIDVNDVIKYLDYIKVHDYDLVALNKGLTEVVDELEVEIADHRTYPVNEYMQIKVSDDKMTATVRFYPPSNDGQRMGTAEMMNDLMIAKIGYGIDQNVFMNHIGSPIYNKDIVIARGTLPRQGKDAYIEYNFNTNLNFKPKRNEDGTVNFHELENISHIKEGDILAVLHVADFGDNGRNVFNAEVRPANVKQLVLKYGKNIRISDDKTVLYSMVNGHASIQGDSVFVSDVYDVPADVDNSTGDIKYDGNVLVHGNVRTGFKIVANGNVEVYGTVEGAEIESQGDVILHRGIQGMTRGKVVAKGNIITKFIESSRVHCEGYIESDTIIQSQVSAGGSIVVKGPKGQIIGGHVRSTEKIVAMVIGSGMGISTSVEVGYDPKLQDEIEVIKENMKQYNLEYNKVSQLIQVYSKKYSAGQLTPDQTKDLIKFGNLTKELKAKIIDCQVQLDEKLASMGVSKNAYISVHRRCNPGTQIMISGDYYNVQNEVSMCKFEKKDGKIIITRNGSLD